MNWSSKPKFSHSSLTSPWFRKFIQSFHFLANGQFLWHSCAHHKLLSNTLIMTITLTLLDNSSLTGSVSTGCLSDQLKFAFDWMPDLTTSNPYNVIGVTWNIWGYMRRCYIWNTCDNWGVSVLFLQIIIFLTKILSHLTKQ